METIYKQSYRIILGGEVYQPYNGVETINERTQLQAFQNTSISNDHTAPTCIRTRFEQGCFVGLW